MMRTNRSSSGSRCRSRRENGRDQPSTLARIALIVENVHLVRLLIDRTGARGAALGPLHDRELSGESSWITVRVLSARLGLNTSFVIGSKQFMSARLGTRIRDTTFPLSAFTTTVSVSHAMKTRRVSVSIVRP